MKFSLACLALLLACVPTVSRAQLLISNGSFELPAGGTTNGNNLGTVPTGWLIKATLNGTASSTLSNLANGLAQGSGTPTPPKLAPFDGSQAEDGNGQDVWVVQDFVITNPSQIQVAFAIGGRDSTSASVASFWEIVSTDTTVKYAQGPNLQPAAGSWLTSTTTPTNLIAGTTTFAAGTYEFAVFLANPHHVDAVSIVTVPEPSTWASMVGMALVVGFAVWRHRARQV